MAKKAQLSKLLVSTLSTSIRLELYPPFLFLSHSAHMSLSILVPFPCGLEILSMRAALLTVNTCLLFIVNMFTLIYNTASVQSRRTVWYRVPTEIT